MDDLLRVYLDPAEIGADGYPFAWRSTTLADSDDGTVLTDALIPIKNLIRMQAGFRCERCGHPYPPGITEQYPRGEWTPCDERCTHGGPARLEVELSPDGTDYVRGVHFEQVDRTFKPLPDGPAGLVTAQWRILTTHHLNGVKHDCRWWNLAALCQRCHLTIQGKVHMHREWRREHSEWFKPHAAGFYAAEFLGEDLSREQTLARLDELLALQLEQHPLPGLHDIDRVY